MKEVKKIGTVAVVFLLVSLIVIVQSVTQKQTEYRGTAPGRNGDITVSIKVEDGKITGGHIIHEEETKGMNEAVATVLNQAIATGSAEGLDTVTGATITSKATMQAIQNALLLAAGKKAVSKDKGYSDCATDLVVIGAGGAGMVAAIEATSLGKKVILLEKMNIVGGNTNNATGGLNAAETKYQAALGITDSKQQFYEDTMKGGYNKNDPALVQTMVDKAAETVDYLVNLGADLTDVGKLAGSTNARGHRPNGGGAVGPYLTKVLEDNCNKMGIDLRLNNKAIEIINDNGAVAGVKVECATGNYTIAAKAVIIATGGFGANADMVISYRPELKGFGTTNHKGATGDGLILAKNFDAALVDIAEIQTHPTVVPGGEMITEAVRGNGAIMVNREGKRFGSEMATRDVMSKAILEQTGQTAYLLFDQGVRESLKAIEGYAKKGLLTQADTLSDLAQKLSIPQEDLEATVAKYNEYQAAGDDPDFGRKGSEMPRALATAPYYAVEVGPAIHHTMGGLKINTEAQVINNAGSVIPGLYAAGEVTGGVHGANRLGGNAVADICVFGKIAADSAVSFLQQ